MPKKIIKKGKKKRKPKKSSERYKKYDSQGKRSGKFCPRCGPGIFLAESKKKDRVYCGKCHYTEFLSKAEKEEKTEKKVEKKTK